MSGGVIDSGELYALGGGAEARLRSAHAQLAARGVPLASNQVLPRCTGRQPMKRGFLHNFFFFFNQSIVIGFAHRVSVAAFIAPCVFYLDDRCLNGEICDFVDTSMPHCRDVSVMCQFGCPIRDCRKVISRNECYPCAQICRLKITYCLMSSQGYS